MSKIEVLYVYMHIVQYSKLSCEWHNPYLFCSKFTWCNDEWLECVSVWSWL